VRTDTKKFSNKDILPYMLPLLLIYFYKYIIYMFKDIKGYLRVIMIL
jgi:hypothetical protein